MDGDLILEMAGAYFLSYWTAMLLSQHCSLEQRKSFSIHD